MSAKSEPTYGVEIIARLLNLTPRRVQQLAKEGVIPKAARGKYSLAASVQGYVRYLQDQLDRPGSENKLELNAERARKTKAEADIAEMQAEKMRGELVDAEEMTELLDMVVQEVRSKLLNTVPARIAVRAKSEKAETKIKAIAKEEISASLTALSQTDVAKLVDET